MKQYCRYCGLCSEIDGGEYWCSEYKTILTEAQIKRSNNCHEYGYTDCGDVITGKQYKPRAAYQRKEKAKIHQIGFDDLEGGETDV